MRISYIFNRKSLIRWGMLTGILLAGSGIVGIYCPVDVLLNERIAAAETKQVAETQHPGEQQASEDNKSHKESKPETVPEDKSETIATHAAAENTSGQPPLMRPEDIRAVMDTLERKRKALQEDEARLKKERSGLDSLKQEIDEKIAELTAVQKRIEDDLNQKAALASQQEKKIEDAELQKIKQLVKVYSSMKPKNAAAIIDKMDMNVVFQVFSNMKGEQVGEILSYVNQDRAAKISEWMATKENVK